MIRITLDGQKTLNSIPRTNFDLYLAFLRVYNAENLEKIFNDIFQVFESDVESDLIGYPLPPSFLCPLRGFWMAH